MAKVTIYDIAKKLNVSPATVTRAMNGQPKVGAEKRKLIIKTAEQMGYKANKVAVSLARKQIKIAVVIYGAVEAFYNKLVDGANIAYQDLRDFNVSRELIVLSTRTHNDNDLIDILHELPNKKFDGVLIYSLNDTPDIAKAIDNLIADGIAVYTMNTDVSTQNNHFCVMNDGHVAGKLAAELLDWMVPNRKICYFMGGEHTQVLLNINKAFTKEAKQRNLEILESYYDDGDMEKAYHEVDDILENHAEVGGIYINSAISEPICRRIVELGVQDKIKIVTSDFLPSIKQNIVDGVVQATIFQDPFLQAKTGFKNLYRVIAEGFVPDRYIFTKPQIISKSNLTFFEG
jgi:LacI family transcriptional regulator